MGMAISGLFNDTVLQTSGALDRVALKACPPGISAGPMAAAKQALQILKDKGLLDAHIGVEKISTGKTADFYDDGFEEGGHCTYFEREGAIWRGDRGGAREFKEQVMDFASMLPKGPQPRYDVNDPNYDFAREQWTRKNTACRALCAGDPRQRAFVETVLNDLLDEIKTAPAGDRKADIQGRYGKIREAIGEIEKIPGLSDTPSKPGLWNRVARWQRQLAA
jgi:hypothetical protein